MYSNMVTSALFYHFHSPICLVMGGCGQGWWLKRPHWTRVGPWWLCEPQNKIPGPVMLYPSRLATLKHRNPSTPVYKKCIKLVYYEACLARILIPQYCCECTTLQHTQYNAQNTKHYMHLNSGATFNVICQLRVITSRCSSEVPAASPSPSGEVGTSADHYYRLGHLCWCRDGSCSPKYGSGAPWASPSTSSCINAFVLPDWWCHKNGILETAKCTSTCGIKVCQGEHHNQEPRT